MRSRFALAALFIVASIAMVGWRPSDETVEVQRIRMHFDSVLVEL